uniref:VOC domain-containing protein n=1 Tax=Guillardia theta TaxID=55529 RepID=A0A7S4V1T4_GUITH|mmetsp:Transcript_9219/g.30770  ORF Transcript_9219/g.30770 Transcript_9219/m.30770 type:complete len:389 (+) Transcript_9219:274-1440(+)
MKHGEYEASGLARCLLTRAGLFLLYIISAPSLLGWPDCKKPAQWLATEKRVAEPADEPWAERGHAQSQPADGWAACHQGCWRRSIHGSSRRTGGAGEGARGLHGVPAGRGGSLAPAALDDGMKGVTMEVDDLEEEAEFWIKGLGMREIRKNAKSVVVGYGSDRMVEGGGHFTFELVQAGEERKTAETQRVEIELPNIPYLISRAQEAGGTLIPRWFGTASFTDLLSPSGYTVRIFMNKDKSNIPYPIKSVSFMAEDVQKSAEALSKSLGMKPVSSFPFPFIGDGAKSLRFQDENVVLHIEKFPKDLQPPKDLRQFRLNVLAADADALAASWGAAGGKTSKDDQNLRLGGLVGQDFVIRDEKVFTAEASKSEIPPPPPPPPVKASNPSQ